MVAIRMLSYWMHKNENKMYLNIYELHLFIPFFSIGDHQNIADKQK